MLGEERKYNRLAMKFWNTGEITLSWALSEGWTRTRWMIEYPNKRCKGSLPIGRLSLSCCGVDARDP